MRVKIENRLSSVQSLQPWAAPKNLAKRPLKLLPRAEMKPDPSLLRTLRDALRQATRDLDSLKLKSADETPQVSGLRRELRSAVLKDYARFAKEARRLSARAKQSSAQRSRDLKQIKKVAHQAAAQLTARRHRHL